MGIPQAVRASKAVAQAERYSGELTLKDLKRLAESTTGQGRLQAEWQAGKDHAGQPQLRGRIEGTLGLLCQRCLKPFDWPVAIDAALQLVDNEAEAAQVLPEADPYEVHDDTLPLREITEDEVLLALPLMPRCKTCENAAAPTPPREEPTSSNPFAALKKLKLKKT
jgi:uncharacterized protein